MPTTITGTDGVSQVQAGAVEVGDLPSDIPGTLINSVSLSDDTGYTTTSTGVFNDPSKLEYTPLKSNSNIVVFAVLGGYVRRDAQTDDDTRAYIAVGTENSSGNYDYFVGKNDYAVAGESNWNSYTQFYWYETTQFGENVSRNSNGNVEVGVYGNSDEDPDTADVSIVVSSIKVSFMEFA